MSRIRKEITRKKKREKERKSLLEPRNESECYGFFFHGRITKHSHTHKKKNLLLLHHLRYKGSTEGHFFAH